MASLPRDRWNGLTLTVGSAGCVRCEPGWRLEPGFSQRLSDYDAWLVWAGRGTMRLRRGRTLALRPGVMLWMRPGGQYVAEQDPDDRLGVTYVHFDLRDRTGRRLTRLPAEVSELYDVGYADTLLRRVVELHRDASPARAAVASQLMLGFLMDVAAAPTRGAGATGTERHHRELVARLANRIRERPGEAPSVRAFAEEAGYSADHLTRVFKQVIGVSPQTLIVRERINRARRLLAESSFTVSQVADVLGYASVYFFSHQFKQKTGQSPTDYRRSLAERG